MIGSSDNSGGVVVGAFNFVYGTECSGFKSRFMLSFFLFYTCRNFSKFS